MKDPVEILTPLQHRTFLEVARGKSIKEIAHGRHVSSKAIDDQWARIMRILKIKSKVEAAHLALQWNYIRNLHA